MRVDKQLHTIPNSNYAIDWNNNSVYSLNYAKGKDIKILKPGISNSGHLFFNVKINGIRKTKYIHQIVMLIKEGPCPEGMEVCHNDGNPLNNHPDNLRYDTHSENQKDKFRHGYIIPMKGVIGKYHHCSKTIKQVSKEGLIIRIWDSINDIKRELGFSTGVISECGTGKRKSAYGFKWIY